MAIVVFGLSILTAYLLFVTYCHQKALECAFEWMREAQALLGEDEGTK